MGTVLKEIQDFVAASYRLDARCLPHLRRYFPKFVWKYYHPADIVDLSRIVNDADYVLLTCPTTDWSNGVIAAAEINGATQGNFCYCPIGWADYWPISELKARGASFVACMHEEGEVL